MRSLILAATLGLLSVTIAPAPAAEALTEKINSQLDQDRFSNAHWGMHVITLDGETLFDLDSEKGFVPASNMKLFTTACALEKLGPDFTYETKVQATGVIEDGTLNGDIVVVGSGDPSLGAWHPDESNNAQKVFDDWIGKLRQAGIKKINGNIVADGRVFNDEFISEDWDYYDLPYWYAAGSSGLAIEENCFRTDIIAGENVGDPPTITINPETEYVTFVNDVETVAEGGSNNADIVWRETEGNHFLYDRTVVVGKTINERGSVWDGELYTVFLFKEALERAGIDVLGEPLNIRHMHDAWRIDKAEKTTLATSVSPPLSDICKTINNVSHNFMADMVLRTLGYKFGEEGGFGAGAKVVEDWLDEIGAPQADRFSMKDGSGLAQSNFVQPRQMTHMLRYMKSQSPASEAFVNSMSSAGESGWIKDRMKDTPLAGKVRAKTGYIGNMRGLSGYIQQDDGDTIVFSSFCNLFTCRLGEVDSATDAALIAILEAE